MRLYVIAGAGLILAGSIFAYQSLATSEGVSDLFADNCASCHGAGLEGGQAPSMLDNDWAIGGDDGSLTQSITEGIDGAGMPAFGSRLSAQEIRSLVVFIRETRSNAGGPEDSAMANNGIVSSDLHDFQLSDVTQVDSSIWGMDFLPDGSLIFTEVDGNLWLYKDGKTTEIFGIPASWRHRQGGLLDVRAHPDYANNGWIYLSFAKKSDLIDEASGRELGTTSVVRGRMSDGKWIDEQHIWTGDVEIYRNPGFHFGSRFVFREGYVYFSTGDGGQQDRAQDKGRVNGKIHRLHDDGRIPEDNPFVGEDGALASVWSYGHRNPQGMTESIDGKQIWAAEHGPRGGDELNLIKKGANFGWPKATFGINYNGTPITEHTSLPGMEDPVHHWTPSIAVAGINFYTGDLFPNWKGDLFVTSLGRQQLHRLRIADGVVTGDEIVLKGKGRIRDVATGSDGALYITLNDRETGRIVRLDPAE